MKKFITALLAVVLLSETTQGVELKRKSNQRSTKPQFHHVWEDEKILDSNVYGQVKRTYTDKYPEAINRRSKKEREKSNKQVDAVIDLKETKNVQIKDEINIEAVNDVKTKVQDTIPAPPTNKYEFVALGDEIDLKTDTKERPTDEKITVADVCQHPVEAIGTWSKTDDGVTDVLMPNTLPECALLVSIDAKNNLQINQVPIEAAQELKEATKTPDEIQTELTTATSDLETYLQKMGEVAKLIIQANEVIDQVKEAQGKDEEEEEEEEDDEEEEEEEDDEEEEEEEEEPVKEERRQPRRYRRTTSAKY